MQLKDAIYDFLTHAEIGKYQSKKTVENYRHYLKRFEKFAKADTDVKTLSTETVRDYRLFLHRTNIRGRDTTLDIKTQQYHLIALRALLKHLQKNDIQTISPEKIELPKVPERQVEVLQREELDAMFNSMDVTKRNGLRDIALLHLLYSTGLRVSEISHLNRKDVNLERCEFRVVGKGRKARIVFLSEIAADHIKRYLDDRQDNFLPLFISNSNRSGTPSLLGEERRLQPQAIERVVRMAARQAGLVKKITPHTLRHTFATELLKNGADIRSVQEMLGHASITTTQIYTHLTNKRLRETHQQYHR
jgi:site-specific recombinase XerD